MTANPIFPNLSFFHCFLRCPARLFLPFFLWLAWPICAMSETFGDTDTTAANTVFVVFKTHLDVGFTDLPSKVEAQYLRNDIPAALDVIETLRNTDDRYIWTVGTWILGEYLDKASPEERRRVEAAIARGDIVWNAMPYTIETESTTAELLDAMLMQLRKLDERYGKQTLAAKMTDVPGHTRSIVPPLVRAGVRLLHIGMNRSTNEPQVPGTEDYPGVCRWRHPDGSEIFLLWKKAYSHQIDLPRGNVLSVNVKHDNRGPHTVEQVRKIYADLRRQYPDKRIVASDLNRVARVLENMTDSFPVFTGEIGDTWIHGFGSAPQRMARVRALGRLYREWVRDGKIDPQSDEAVRFAIRLGLIAEHTWGVDCVKFLKNETPDKYNVDGFRAARLLPEFRFLEASWRQIDDYIPQAVAQLPAALQAEANEALAEAGRLPAGWPSGTVRPKGLTDAGAYRWTPAGGSEFLAGLFTLQTFDNTDFWGWTHTWMERSGAKSGMVGSQAVSAAVNPRIEAVDTSGDGVQTTVSCALKITDKTIDDRLYPGAIRADYRVAHDGRSLELDFTLFDKPANRMAEAYWLSFVPQGITAVRVEKLGSAVDVGDVVPGGNARMMALDRYVELETPSAVYRIYSLDVPLVLIGDRESMGYKTPPDLAKGVHFCLFNNFWGVNYSMWWEGSQRFRFRIEKR